MMTEAKIRKASQINDYLVMSIAGNASDALRFKKYLSAELKLKEAYNQKDKNLYICFQYFLKIKCT